MLVRGARATRFLKVSAFETKTFSRSCFVPVYGKCNVTPLSLPSYQDSLSNPNMQNRQWSTKNIPVDRLDFLDTLSSKEIRIVELTKQNRLNEVMLTLKQGATIAHTQVVEQVARALARQGRITDINSLSQFSETESTPELRPMLFYANVVDGNSEQAKLLLTELKQEGIFIAPSHQQEFMKLVTKNVSADEMVKIAKEYDIVPSLSLHDTYIDALLEDDKIEMANEYLNFMQMLGTQPDTRILNKFIFWYVSKGELQAAEDTMMSMKPPIRPNLDSFSKTTAAYALQNNGAKVDYMFWRVGRRQLQIDRKMYADVLYAFARSGQHKRIEKTLYRMRKEKLEPEIDAFDAILRGYAEAGDYKHVNLTFDELRFKQFDVDQEVPTTPGQFCRPTASTYHGILNGYMMNKMYHHGIEIFRFMRGRMIMPLPETLLIIKDMLVKCGSLLPADISEMDDVVGRSYHMRALRENTVQDEHLAICRFLYDVSNKVPHPFELKPRQKGPHFITRS